MWQNLKKNTPLSLVITTRIAQKTAQMNRTPLPGWSHFFFAIKVSGSSFSLSCVCMTSGALRSRWGVRLRAWKGYPAAEKSQGGKRRRFSGPFCLLKAAFPTLLTAWTCMNAVQDCWCLSQSGSDGVARTPECPNLNNCGSFWFVHFPMSTKSNRVQAGLQSFLFFSNADIWLFSILVHTENWVFFIPTWIFIHRYIRKQPKKRLQRERRQKAQPCLWFGSSSAFKGQTGTKEISLAKAYMKKNQNILECQEWGNQLNLQVSRRTSIQDALAKEKLYF